MKKYYLLSLLTFLSLSIFAQEPQAFPKTVVYGCIVHPLITFDADGSHANFNGSYTVGFPFGINIIKNQRIGFSFEMLPMMKSEKGITKMSNLVFHPGILFRFKNDFAFITRVAFETSGRYGFTTIFNKVLLKKKNASYFAALPLPFRFGNDKPASAGVAFMLGVAF